VLALHGLTNTSEVWRSLAAALPGHRVLAPDLPGRGGSLTTNAGPGLAGHAAEVVRVADECGLDDVVLVGHSMGGYLAPVVAAKLGDRVRKLVLLDGGVPPEPRWTVRRPVVRAMWTLLVRPLGRRFSDPDAFVDQIEGRAVARRPDLRPFLLEWAAYLLDDTGRPRVNQSRLIDDAVDTLAGRPTLPLLAPGRPRPHHPGRTRRRRLVPAVHHRPRPRTGPDRTAPPHRRAHPRQPRHHALPRVCPPSGPAALDEESAAVVPSDSPRRPRRLRRPRRPSRLRETTVIASPGRMYSSPLVSSDWWTFLPPALSGFADVRTADRSQLHRVGAESAPGVTLRGQCAARRGNGAAYYDSIMVYRSGHVPW